jgi:ubiquinone/menaquinone biosynthesis C-methylase UbiE
MEMNEVKTQFGKQAENYVKYRKPYPEELYNFFFSLLPSGDKKILDIACGPGNSTERLLRDGSKVFGCDIDPLMIDEARKQAEKKNLSVEYTVSSAEKLPYEDNYFDAINVGTAFHWFVNEKAMSEIKRVLKNNGMLFVFWTLTNKDMRAEEQALVEIFRKYNFPRLAPELRDLEYISTFFKSSGFQNVSTNHIALIYQVAAGDRVGLEKTNAGYGLLSDEDKKKFLDELTQALTANLQGRENFTVEEDLQIVYGFKS